MALADYRAYIDAQAEVDAAYADTDGWTKSASSTWPAPASSPPTARCATTSTGSGTPRRLSEARFGGRTAARSGRWVGRGAFSDHGRLRPRTRPYPECVFRPRSTSARPRPGARFRPRSASARARPCPGGVSRPRSLRPDPPAPHRTA